MLLHLGFCFIRLHGDAKKAFVGDKGFFWLRKIVPKSEMVLMELEARSPSCSYNSYSSYSSCSDAPDNGRSPFASRTSEKY